MVSAGRRYLPRGWTDLGFQVALWLGFVALSDCAPLVMAVVMPLAAHGQESVLGTWNGRVDKEVQLTIRGNNVSSNTLSGQQLNGRFRLASSLPRQDGTVRVAVTNGRGDVSVVQQPSAQQCVEEP